jgi:hypothetical protein
LHRHGRHVDLREAVDAQREEGEPANDRQQKDDDGREHRPPHANLSQLLHETNPESIASHQ